MGKILTGSVAKKRSTAESIGECVSVFVCVCVCEDVLDIFLENTCSSY